MPDQAPMGPFTKGLPNFFENLAAAVGGFIAGHAMLMLCAGILLAAKDNARAQFVDSIAPMWNAFGLLLIAWVVYYLIRLAGEWVQGRALAHPPEPESPSHRVSTRKSNRRASQPRQSKSAASFNWKQELRDAKKMKNASRVLEIRDRLATEWSPARISQLDARLGMWFTKYFQQSLLRGKAPEVLPELERVAEIFSDSQDFKHFSEVLVTVRQSVELRTTIEKEIAEEANRDLPDDEPPRHESNGK